MAKKPSSKAATSTLSALIIARNEEAMISNCLETVAWCDQIIVIDQQSSDATAELAKQAGARVLQAKSSHDFAELRMEAAAASTSDWLLYVDADERVTPELAQELRARLRSAPESIACFSLRRKNVHYGTLLEAGGWQNDVLERVFRRRTLRAWKGSIHESAVYDGEREQLDSPLWHFSHRDTVSGLKKSADWTHREAALLAEGGVSTVTFLTILRKGMAEFWRRTILWSGYRDGQTGLIEALIQGVNRMLVYIQVWELQQHPSITQRYEELERGLQKKWQEAKDV